MNGGNGCHSYVQNSHYQRALLHAAKDVITEAILEKVDITNPWFNSSSTLRVADFGCSVGPNTFIVVQNIIEALELLYRSKQHNPEIPEFHVFFNDHVDNDFNTLFRSLPFSRRYFAAGVPGSFHDRLFPKSTLHIVHASYALHWLSQVPTQLADRNSPAWNKGRIHGFGATSKEVREAFSAQFGKDLQAFLNARARELVGGGLMLLLVSALPNEFHSSQTNSAIVFDLLGSCLIDMAKMGIISEDNVDSFNLPIHLTCPGELEAFIEKNGHFKIEKMEELSNPVRRDPPDFQMLSSHLRATFEGALEEHFGNEIMDELFDRFTNKIGENSHIIYDQQYIKEIEIFISLKHRVTDYEV
ncbi:hypothetical protein PVL29_018752 [Vitis rotundifolia]|nr:hypothetical protein PVL29_018752 [Vitis rotundifolia]